MTRLLISIMLALSLCGSAPAQETVLAIESNAYHAIKVDLAQYLRARMRAEDIRGRLRTPTVYTNDVGTWYVASARTRQWRRLLPGVTWSGLVNWVRSRIPQDHWWRFQGAQNVDTGEWLRSQGLSLLKTGNEEPQ